MPEASLWTLVISLIILALGLTYKIAGVRHTLKRTQDELTAAQSKITSFNEKQNEQIQNIQMHYETRINELTEKIAELSHDSLLDEVKVNILKFLSINDDKKPNFIATCFGSLNYIATYLNMKEQIVRFHLTELEKNKMIYAHLATGVPVRWTLADKGLGYLIKHKLISQQANPLDSE